MGKYYYLRAKDLELCDLYAKEHRARMHKDKRDVYFFNRMFSIDETHSKKNRVLKVPEDGHRFTDFGS